MLKTITRLACLSGLALSGTIFADGMQGTTQTQGPEVYSGGFTIGTELSNSATGTEPFLTFGYFDQDFLFDVGFNYLNISSTPELDDNNLASFHAHLGLRNQLSGNLFFTYGIHSGVTVGESGDQSTPYSVAAFIGLDLQVAKHFLISTKINPYEYSHVSDDVNYNQVFRASSISLSYVF